MVVCEHCGESVNRRVTRDKARDDANAVGVKKICKKCEWNLDRESFTQLCRAIMGDSDKHDRAIVGAGNEDTRLNANGLAASTREKS